MPIRALDLFHGVGGSSLGAQMAGVEIVAGIDYWKVATESYQNNFPRTIAVNEDIWEVRLNDFHRRIGDIDLIIASPECTNHSCAKGSRIPDEKSRLTAFQVIRFAREFKPRRIIVENVIQMRFWEKYQNFIGRLHYLGYTVKEQELNAQNFGVPQTRKRLFLICSLIGEVNQIKPQVNEVKSICEVIDFNGNYQFTRLFTPKRAEATIERAIRAITELGNNEPFLIVYYGTDGSGGWQPLDRPLRAITTLDRFALVKPSYVGYLMRMLQPEELKLAMGFPIEYRLHSGTRRDKIKLMGNAVCPPVMKAIVQNLIKT